MSLGTTTRQATPLVSSARRIVPAHFSWESKAATRIAVRASLIWRDLFLVTYGSCSV
jgi:hypothetical protein